MEVFKWTEDKIEKLRELASTTTSTELGKIIGVTRNAVIGKCKRLNIPLRNVRRDHMDYKTQRPPKMGIEHHPYHKVSYQKTHKKIKLPNETPIYHKPAKWPDLRFLSDGYCREIIGSPESLVCCALPAYRDNSYCIDHFKENIVPLSPNKYRL